MTEVIIALIAALGSSGITALITVSQAKKMTLKRIELLSEQTKQTAAKTEETAVNSLKTALNTLNADLIKPISDENKIIKNELKRLTNELTKFRKAIEKIQACAHADSCPVTRELQNNKQRA